MKCAAYKLYGDSEQERIVACVQDRLNRWLSEWIDREDACQDLSVTHESVFEDAALYWRLYSNTSGTYFAIAAGSDASLWVPQLLYGNKLPTGVLSSDSALVNPMGEEILSALATKFIGPSLPDMELTNNTLGRITHNDGMGLLVFTVSIESGMQFRILVGQELADQFCKDMPVKNADVHLVSLTSALSSQTVHLTVSAGEGELSVDEILTLRTGDVVPLSLKVRDWMKVQTLDGRVIAKGNLGMRQGHFAVQVTTA